MDTKVNIISESEHELEVTLSYEEISEEIKAAYKKEAKSITMPGFRKGKVPMHLLKKVYGEAIEYKASEDIANKKFWDIVKEKNLEPISTPSMVDLDFVPGEKLFFKISYEVKPELELKNYTKQVIEKPVFKVRDEDIETEIENIRKSKASFEETEDAADEKTKITVNLQRKDKDGNALEGQISENIALDLSDPKVNPEIVTNAVGKKVGETFEFTFTDEHKHGEETHKEEFFYDAEVVKVEKFVYAEENEEFFETVSNKKAKTLDELKSFLKENFENYMNGQADQIFRSNIIKMVMDGNEFKVPDGYVENIAERMLQMEKQNAQQYKTPFNEAEMRPQMKPRAEWNAKWQILLENLARIEKLEVTDADLEEIAKEEAEKTGISAEKMVKYLKDSGRKDSLLEEKVLKFLEENNTINEVDPAEKAEEENKKAAKKTSTKKAAAKKTTKKEDKDSKKEDK